MRATGESYQTAQTRVLGRQRRVEESGAGPHLVAAHYFGLPITVAAYEVVSRLRLVLVSGAGGPVGLPWGNPLPILVGSEALQ